MKKNITFIVTVYNRLDYLKNIMKCLIAQTYTIDHLIIADDGSSESVSEAISDLLPLCNFKITHVYQKDLGFRLSKSRNNGANIAEDGLLIFADQDLIFGKNYVKAIIEKAKLGCVHPHKVLWTTYEEKENIIKFLKKHDFSYPNFYTEILNMISSKQKKDRNKQNLKDFIRAFKFKFKLRSKPVTLGGASFSIFKEDYIKINGFDETFVGHGAEDTDFGYRAQIAGINPKIIFFNEAPIHMNHSKDPTFGSNKSKITNKKNNLKDITIYVKYGVNSPLDKDEFAIKTLKNL